MQNIEKLKPTGLFTNYIYKAIPLAFDESMSYYETLCGLLDYLKNTVIPTVNNNADAMVELQNLYTELHDYVEHYFDNLDVQEEINNKLDEMAESGQLTDIIAQYLTLAGMLTYNTVSEMKVAQNLSNGSICSTLGFYNINDGGNATYKVRYITNEDIVDEMFIVALYDNTLIAELIYGDEINIKKLGALESLTDNTTIIQTALDKLTNVFIPKGQYNVTNLIASKNSQYIHGESGSALISKSDGITLKITGNNWKIDNISIKQSDDTTYQNIGLRVDGSSGFSHNLGIYKCYDGIYCTGSGTDNLFLNTTVFSGIDVAIRVYSSGNQFDNFIVGFGGTVGVIAEKGGGVFSNGRIFGCRYGMQVINSVAWTISNISIQQNKCYGLLVDNSSNNIITGINFLANNQENNVLTNNNSSNLVVINSHNNLIECVSQEQLNNPNWSSNPANSYIGDYTSYNNVIRINQLRGNNTKYQSSFAQYPNNSYGLYKFENPSNVLEINGIKKDYQVINLYKDTTTTTKFSVDESANQANMTLTSLDNGFNISVGTSSQLMNNPNTAPENRVRFSFDYTKIISDLQTYFINAKVLSLEFDYEISDENVGGCVSATIWYNSVSVENRKFLYSTNAWTNPASFTGKGHLTIPFDIIDNKNNNTDVLSTINIIFNFCRTATISDTPSITITNLKLKCS